MQLLTDINSLKHILKKSRRCSICLRRHHINKECYSAMRCKHCNGQQHTKICQIEHSIPASTSPQIPIVFHVETCTDAESTLKQFWDLEPLGIKAEVKPLNGSLVQTISFKDGQYEVQLTTLHYLTTTNSG